MSDKDARKDLGVHFHKGGGSEAVVVDDLRPRGKRAAKPSDEAAAGEATSPEPEGLDALPLPEAGPSATTPAEPANETADEVPAAEVAAPAKKGGGAKQTMPATPRAKGIPTPDARIPDVEKAMARGDWAAVAKLLAPTGAPTEPGELPPPLRLLWAVATKEADAKAGTAVDALAIEAVAELLSVSKQSPVALVLAKRMLRKRTWASQPAPSAAVSTFIVVGGLAIGVGLGWLASILLF